MELSTVQSTTANSLETSKAQEQQGTNPALARVASGRSVLLSLSEISLLCRCHRKTKHWICCRFCLLCPVCLLSANLTITSDPISVSEGQSFSISCISDVSNYDEVYWNTSAGIKIHPRFYNMSRRQDGAESVLTVKTSTREWNGKGGARPCSRLSRPLEMCNGKQQLPRTALN